MERINSQTSPERDNNNNNSVRVRSRGEDMHIEFTNPAFHLEEEPRGPPNHNRVSRNRANSFDD